MKPYLSPRHWLRRCCFLLLLLLPFQAHANSPVILVLGDSLSAGYGIDIREGWVSLLEKRVKDEGYDYQVVNASVSGETAGGGLARLPALLEHHQPVIVVLELGGNDGLRGHPVNIMERQLNSIIEKSRDASAEVLLLGMHIPPNYGKRYTEQFHNTYGKLAKKHSLPLVDFFLENVATDASLMQQDGIHPVAAAQPAMLENIWPALKKMLD
ncbi:arylesterase [Cellvibrio polysaccharolyticus]|uniref:Arylesterase n=1 Tax=Cellvibrio polysaccharolyticus TaxID=2082724 RepID=A0A928V220_9GAMM|nr:arylesterase [Cellvibrio polysaccharolyticus]MBE8717338.1 arylesterase [Cellvibrio polysaccharolyticus]